MAKKNENFLEMTHAKHHIVPSTIGGVVAYLLSGVVLLGVAVFASVWVGNMIGHRLHHK